MRDEKWLRLQQVQLRERLYRIFQKQMEWVVSNIQPLYVNTAIKDIDDLIEQLIEEGSLSEVIEVYAKRGIIKGAKASIIDLGMDRVGFSFSVKSPFVSEYLTNLKDILLSNRQGAISWTTKQKIKEILLRAANEGLSYTQVSKLIRDQAIEGVFSRARGELISIIEMGRAYGAGQYGQVEQYRARFPDLIIEKMWLTARDEKVRETHKQNEDDGWIPFDAIFSGTSEKLAPSKEFRCRCSFVTRVSGQKESYIVQHTKHFQDKTDFNEVKTEINSVRKEILAKTIETKTQIVEKSKEIDNLIGVLGEVKKQAIESDQAIAEDLTEYIDEKAYCAKEYTDERVAEVKKNIKVIKGDKGDQGVPGVAGASGRDAIDGRDGKDGSPDTPSIIRDKLETLKGKDRLSARYIKDMPTGMISPGGFVAGRWGQIRGEIADQTDLVDYISSKVPSGLTNLDGGSPDSIYLISQVIDGETP